jgi:hypothetical protein
MKRDRHTRRVDTRRVDDATVDDVLRVFEETDTVKEADESDNGQRMKLVNHQVMDWRFVKSMTVPPDLAA